MDLEKSSFGTSGEPETITLFKKCAKLKKKISNLIWHLSFIYCSQGSPELPNLDYPSN
jgi:hypothetical protein